jgi:hypothetical protein
MSVKIGHRMTTALYYGFAFFILTIFLGYIAIRALNIIANEEILHPVGVPMLVGAMLFFLTLGIAQSEHVDTKVAETTPTSPK